MPRFSIVALMTGDEEQERAFAQTLSAQTVDDFEAILVFKDDSTSSTEELAALGAHAIHSSGTAGEQRLAALETCSGDYVFFTDTETRLSPAMLQVLSSQIDGASKGEGLPEVVVFHTQFYDRVEKAYLTRRMSPRRAMAVEPYCPAFHAERVFQRLGGGIANKLFLKGFLSKRPVSFKARAAHDDDPAILELLSQTTKVVSSSLPLAIVKYDPCGELADLGLDGLEASLADAAELASVFEGEGQAHAFLPSYLEWLCGYCVFRLNHVDDRSKTAFMDIMRKVALPVLERDIEETMKPRAWEGYDAFCLACMDRLELFRAALDVSGMLGEMTYERTRLDFMAERLRQSLPDDQASAKPKRRGLFRRS